jgi:predicted RNA binding protein YcfA (HicA-like mRNA interferase family)
MSKRAKLRERIAKNAKNISFEDLRTLLETYGFKLTRTKGSHHSFVGRVGGRSVLLTVPYRRPLQTIYVKKALALIEQIESETQEPDEEDNE